MKKVFLLIAAASFCLLARAQQIPSFIKDSLDIYIEKALIDWQIPGVAVCVVKDGKLAVMKGYGIKEINSDSKVDENTLFMIGSNTKAFTATALALLQSEKKLSLDDKVQKWLLVLNYMIRGWQKKQLSGICFVTDLVLKLSREILCFSIRT